MSPMSGLRQQLKMLGTALLGKRATKSVKKKPFTEVEIKGKLPNQTANQQTNCLFTNKTFTVTSALLRKTQQNMG
ncbi:hypothetical protein M5D96_007846 [Drosophila gunungcola]|uniref:Uncharacterized protein n=1 Tax=Drosophila gunungcola TaxID=103775 RepID=A0A9P9YLF0_9MUSC|nr:hypothetical protein M5D96_007846 [Drosophila gunungcola]